MMTVLSKEIRDVLCTQLKKSTARKAFDPESMVRASLTPHQQKMRSHNFEKCSQQHIPKEQISFASDTMEIWLNDGKAIHIDLSLPLHVIEDRL